MLMTNVTFTVLLVRRVLSVLLKSCLRAQTEHPASVCRRLSKGIVTANINHEHTEVKCSLLHGICALCLQCDSGKAESRAGQQPC